VPCPNSPYGDHVKALSWAVVDEIIGHFQLLNPYDRSIMPGSVLKCEKENLDPHSKARLQLYCYAISAKRYSLYNSPEHDE